MRFLIVRVFGPIGRFALVQFEAAGVSVRAGNTVPPKKLQTSMGCELHGVTLSPHPFPASGAHPPLRSRQVSLGEAERFPAQLSC